VEVGIGYLKKTLKDNVNVSKFQDCEGELVLIASNKKKTTGSK
jgi:hypothetical protein